MMLLPPSLIGFLASGSPVSVPVRDHRWSTELSCQQSANLCLMSGIGGLYHSHIKWKDGCDVAPSTSHAQLVAILKTMQVTLFSVLFSFFSFTRGYLIDDRDSAITYIPTSGPYAWIQFADPTAYMGTTWVQQYIARLFEFELMPLLDFSTGMSAFCYAISSFNSWSIES